MLQLSPQDAQFLYMETEENLSNVTMVCIYEKSAAIAADELFNTLKTHIKSRLHTSSIFKRRLVRVPMDLDYPYWVDDEYFDFDSHINRHKLESPGNWQQLTELVGNIHSRPLDMRRPVWEIHIVEEINDVPEIPSGSFALVAKIHHSAVDGASTLKFFAGLSDVDASGTPAVDLKKSAESSGVPPTGKEMWKYGLSNTVGSPFKLGKSLWNSAPTLMPALAKKLSAKSSTSDSAEASPAVPTTSLNQHVSPNKCFDGVEFQLNDLKQIQSAVADSKINDVVLAIVSGAIRSYLAATGDLPDSPLFAWVPISTRASDDASHGNQVSAMTTNLHTTMIDPIKRLSEITAFTKKTKENKGASVAGVLTDFSQQLPGAVVAVVSRAILASGVTAKLCNLAVSNVPGTNKPMYIAGNKCLKQFGMVPLGEGMGVFLVAISYNGKLTLSVTSTKEIITDMTFFCRCLQSSMDELMEAVAQLHAPKVKSAAKGRRNVKA